MKLHLLGSSGGKSVPRPFCSCQGCRIAHEKGGRSYRTRSAMNIYLSGEGPQNGRYKVDQSPDTVHHIISFGLDLTKLEHLLITHAHFDHCDPYFLTVRKKALSGIDNMKLLNVYGSGEVEEFLKAQIPDFSVCKMVFYRVEPFEWLRIGQLEVFSLLAQHTSQSLNYVIKAEGATVLMGWDTGIWPDETWEKVSGFCFDGVFLECSIIGYKGKTLRPGHHDQETFLSMKERMHKMGLVKENAPFVAVHVADNSLLSHEEAQKIMDPYGVIVGYDGLLIDLKGG